MAFTLRSDSKARDLVLDRLTVAVIGTAAVFSAMVSVQAEASSVVFVAWSLALLLLPAGALAVRLVLSGNPNVAALHTTNGRWDLIAELRADNLEAFDQVLGTIRRIPGIANTETSILLSTHKL